MRRAYRPVIGFVLAVAMFLVPARTQAGGAPQGGGVGGGGPVAGGLAVQIDGAAPGHHVFSYDTYYPRAATVTQGETVTWHFAADPSAFHTVALLPAGANPQQVWQQEFHQGAPIPDADDGPKAVQFPLNNNQAPGCGNSYYYPGTAPCSFTGSAMLNSGLQFNPVNPKTGKFIPGAPLPSYSVQINAPPGLYHYICLVHGPSMQGTIRVVAAGTPAPSPAAQFQQGQAEYQQDTQRTLQWETHFPVKSQVFGGHTVWHVHAGLTYHNIEIDEFVPQHLHVKPGDSIVWAGSNAPGGFHTITFPDNSGASVLPLECEASGRDAPYQGGPICPTLEAGIAPQGAFPSGPPGKPYTGGFYGSGIIAIPQPHQWSASFPKAGRYTYECLVHFGMDATVTVG